MGNIVFNELADCLRYGREIEIAYNGRQYSITNHSGSWYLRDDANHIRLEAICRLLE